MVTDNKNLQETIYKLSLHTLLTCTCVQACCLYICTMLHHCGPLWPRTDCKTCRFILMSKQPWGPKASQSIGHVMAVKICYRGCQQHTHTPCPCFVASTNYSGTFLLFDSPPSQLWAVPALPWHGWCWCIVECQMVSEVPVLLCTDRNWGRVQRAPYPWANPCH